VIVQHVEPFVVPHLFAAGLHRIHAMFLEPHSHVVTKILLGPEHPRQCLTHNEGFIFVDSIRRDALIELIRLALTSLHNLSKALKRITYDSGRQVT